VGRVANRIAKAKFTLDGVTYQLAVNNGENSLHGGVLSFGKVVWQAHVILMVLKSCFQMILNISL